MPRLIADLNLNSERGREAGRTGETEEERRGKKRWVTRRGEMGARTQTHTPAKKFVYEKCSTYSRGS